MANGGFVLTVYDTPHPILLPPTHHADGWTWLYVSRGAPVLTTSFYVVPLQEAALCLVPAGISYHVSGEGRVVTLTAPCSVSHGISERVTEELWEMFCIHATHSPICIMQEDARYAALFSCFMKAEEECLSREFGYDLRAFGYLALALGHLLLSYGRQTGEDSRPIYHNLIRLSPALRYMETHLDSHVDLDTLGDLVELTPDYFARLLRECTAFSPVEYMQRLRVNRAIRHLIASDAPLPVVARSIGITSSYLSDLFRTILGMPPGTYRRMGRGQ